MQNIRNGVTAFSDFFHEVRKVMEPDFWEKVLDGPVGPKKSTELSKNQILGGFDKNLIHSYMLFILECKSTNGPLIFCKNYRPE